MFFIYTYTRVHNEYRHADREIYIHSHTHALFKVYFLVVTFHSRIANIFMIKKVVEGKLAKNMEIYCCLMWPYIPDLG